MKRLYAFFENKRVGVLTKNDDEVYSFEYEGTWLEDSQAFPISLSMPLGQTVFGNKATLSFFENLLPEGDVRRELEAAHKISGVLDFLAEFGRDCAGAITLATDPNHKAAFGPAELVPIEMKKIYQAIEENRSVADVVSDTSAGYLSLAGAQDKFPAVFKQGKFYLPKSGHPTTHIVKVPIWRHSVKESVYNEQYCMELARAVGMEVPSCEVVDGVHPLYVIERYDRRLNPGDGSTRRIHQQDLCQAQGFYSANKYETKGGPNLKQNYDFLAQHIPPKLRLRNMERFLDWVCFNLIIGNNDSHSKNISLLLFESNKYQLAPFYDLMSTAIYPKLDAGFSFRIGDRDEFSKIGKNQIEQLEDQLGLKRTVFRRRLESMVTKISSECGPTAKNFSRKFPAARIQKRINELIIDRIKSLKFQKALD
jgi:serine/threonine-protein kinase HipA